MVGLNGLEPSTSRLSGVRSNQLSYRPLERVMRIELTTSAWKAEVLPLNYTRIWWVRTESNRRHLELQSNALPTELLTHFVHAKLAHSFASHDFYFKNGGPDRDRTGDLLRDRQAC